GGRNRLFYVEEASVNRLSVEIVNGVVTLKIILHQHKAKAFGPSALGVAYDASFLHRPEAGEQRFQQVDGGGRIQIADVDALHRFPSESGCKAASGLSCAISMPSSSTSESVLTMPAFLSRARWRRRCSFSACF